MSRRDRKQPNRTRRRTKATVSEAIRPLRVSVITSPKSGKSGPALHRDVELVKAALLYADDVELVSPGAVIISSVATLAEGGLPAMVELLGSFDDAMLRYLLKRDVPANFREMLPLIPLMLDPNVARLAGQEEQVAEWRTQLEPALQQLNDLAEGLAKESGALDLVPALERRALHLEVTALEAEDALAMVHQFTKVIEGRLRDPRTRVLFDAEAGKLAKLLLATSADPGLGFTRAGQAAVGSGLIARLPAFPQAPMDELLDLRSDLTESLRRYRSAVVTLSAGLDPGLGSQVEERIDDIWIANVEPAITELRSRKPSQTMA